MFYALVRTKPEVNRKVYFFIVARKTGLQV